jgi:hypothetical protein
LVVRLSAQLECGLGIGAQRLKLLKLIKPLNTLRTLAHEGLRLAGVVPDVTCLGLLLQLFYLASQGRDVKETPSGFQRAR